MTFWIRILTTSIGAALIAGGALLAYTSWRERDTRATWIGAAIILVGILWSILALWAPVQVAASLLFLALTALIGGTIVLLWPHPLPPIDPEIPKTRVDERRIPFSWIRLQPNTPEHTQYYTLYPERRAIEDAIRSLPGLLSPTSKEYHPLAYTAAEVSFMLIEAIRNEVEGDPVDQRIDTSPEIMTPFIKCLARYYGALDVGVTHLRDYHVYTHIGRGTGTYGASLEPEHRYAIAFTVEMRYPIMQTAPHAPVTMESAHQYVQAATIALRLAYFIRLLGYPARAHIDSNYRVIAPLVARDAGLGELGRMGLLITPRLGPRVRLGVVTTDLPLIPDPRNPDPSVIDMCRYCKKCATNCPGQAIPMGDRELIDGALRWKIDIDRCFRYWNIAGTDCGRCIAVCPYSHPDTLLHNIVRQLIRRSGTMRRTAVWFDDLLYGRKPSPHLPHWLPPSDTISREPSPTSSTEV